MNGVEALTCSVEELLDFLKSRRSIRRFKSEKPPLFLVLKVLDVARFAPSAKNSQPWEFIVVDDPNVKEKLARIHVGARPLENAPMAIVVVSDKTRSPTSYLVDGANAVMYILLALHAVGLGGVWIQTLRNIKEIQEILSIPEEKIPVAIIALGYPDESPKPKPRRPLEELVHYNKYGARKPLI